MSRARIYIYWKDSNRYQSSIRYKTFDLIQRLVYKHCPEFIKCICSKSTDTWSDWNSCRTHTSGCNRCGKWYKNAYSEIVLGLFWPIAGQLPSFPSFGKVFRAPETLFRPPENDFRPLPFHSLLPSSHRSPNTTKTSSEIKFRDDVLQREKTWLTKEREARWIVENVENIECI